MFRETKDLEFARDHLRSFKAQEPRSSEETDQAKKKLGEIKTIAVSQDKQDFAKEIWCLEQIVEIQKIYLFAFECLKKNEFYKSWCELETCEIKIFHLSRHHNFISENDDFGLRFIDKKVKQLQGLFPYKMFTSPEFIVLEQKCSICNNIISLRNPCGHKLGEIYDGKSCGREITKCKLLAMAITENPRNKYTVIFSGNGKDNERTDHYNYSFLKHLFSLIESPFENWSYHWTKIRHPHSRYKHIGKNDLCPCESRKKYRKCCLNQDGVLRPHLEFILDKELPKEKQKIVFTD